MRSSSTNSTFQGPAKLWGASPQCLWQSNTKLLPNEHKTRYVSLCQGAVLAVGSPGNRGPEGERDEPQAGGSPGVGPWPPLPGDLNSGGRRRQCAPTLKYMPCGPLLWVEGIKSALWKATARRSPRRERMAAVCPGRGEAGVEPGWQRKHLERQEGGREEE